MKIDFKKSLNKYLNSKEFLLNLNKFQPKFRTKVIGLAIEYLILHKDFWQIDEYISFLLKKQKNINLIGNYWKIEDKREYLINGVSKKLLTNNRDKITSYINKNFYQEGFFYHSFNSGLLNVIKKKGLNTSNKLSLLKEIENVKQIFNQVGFYNLFGFIDSYHKREIYLSANFQSLYKYALSSPEWFDHFTSRSLNHLLSPSVYEEAFYNREHEKAKSNIISLIANINSKKIISLNKSWKRRIKRKGFNLEKLLNYCLEQFDKSYKNSKQHIAVSFEEIIKNENSSFVKIDNKKFSNKERLYIYMETYDNFNRKLNNQKIYNKITIKNQRKIIKLFDRFWKIFGQKKYNSFLIPRSIIKKDKNVNYNKLFIENEWDITYSKYIKYKNLLLIILPDVNLEK